MVEVWALKMVKRLTLCLLREQRLQCLHRLPLLGGLASTEKHVVYLSLMEGWQLPALFPNHAVHVTISDPFTTIYYSIILRDLLHQHVRGIMPNQHFEMGGQSFGGRFCKAPLITSYPGHDHSLCSCVFTWCGTQTVSPTRIIYKLYSLLKKPSQTVPTFKNNHSDSAEFKSSISAPLFGDN